jgi:hypothetical protein
VGVGIAAALGFGGTYVIMKVINILIGIRVDPKVEESGIITAVPILSPPKGVLLKKRYQPTRVPMP